MISLFFNCEVKSQNINQSEAIAYLNEFYNEYILNCDSPLPNNEFPITIQEKYSTKSLIQKLNGARLDFDPYLNSQDCNKNWLKSMKITSTQISNVFEVSFVNTYQNQSIRIKLKLSTESDEIKISDLYTF